MFKIWITFVVTLGLALLTLFFVNKNYNNGKISGENKIKLENIVSINSATQSEIDDIMKIYLDNDKRIKHNENVKAPTITNCIVDVEWLRKLKTLK
jgi:hypothetical protein